MIAQTRRGVAFARIALWTIAVGALIFSALTYFSLKGTEVESVKVALITADDDAYWNRVIEGAEAAAADNGVSLTVMKSDGTMDTQSRLVQQAMDEGYNGIAVSPVDANKQGLLLRRAGKAASLVTVDSDSEVSGRLCFVGADNYAMGRACGELIKEAMPDGARVAIVMGPMLKANGERRRQGIIDELLDRSYGPGRPTEPVDEVHSGGKYTIVATLIDQIDPEGATENVTRALTEDPTIDCIVGLFAYSTPAAMRAVDGLSMGDRVTLIAFDDREETLEAIAEGKIYATLAQDQFSYGYDSVRLLADAAKGSDASIPLTEQIHFPAFTVRGDNVDGFRTGQRPSMPIEPAAASSGG